MARRNLPHGWISTYRSSRSTRRPSASPWAPLPPTITGKRGLENAQQEQCKSAARISARCSPGSRPRVQCAVARSRPSIYGCRVDDPDEFPVSAPLLVGCSAHETPLARLPSRHRQERTHSPAVADSVLLVHASPVVLTPRASRPPKCRWDTHSRFGNPIAVQVIPNRLISVPCHQMARRLWRYQELALSVLSTNLRHSPVHQSTFLVPNRLQLLRVRRR